VDEQPTHPDRTAVGEPVVIEDGTKFNEEEEDDLLDDEDEDVNTDDDMSDE
jgi:hypothetical protein